MTRAHHRWVAELTATAGTDVDRLLELPAGLDVWEHRGDTLVVAAEAAQLEDLERRQLATVVWLGPVEQFSGQRSTEATDNEEEP
jgi:hypothetical protein